MSTGDPATSRASGGRTPRILYVLVGLPGSGKTTYARRYLSGCVRVSLDDLRYMLSGRAYESRLEPLVGEIGTFALEAALARCEPDGFDVVFDATNVTRALRRRSLDRAHTHGLRVIAVWLKISPARARSRNRQRARVVPDEAMDRFEASFEPPTVDEGFDKVIEVESRD